MRFAHAALALVALLATSALADEPTSSRVKFKNLVKSRLTDQTTSIEAVLPDAEAYVRLFGAAPKQVDFSKQQLVVVSYGLAPRSVEVDVKEIVEQDGARVVRYVVTGLDRPGASGAKEETPDFLANPFQVVRVAKSDLPYVFERSFEQNLTGTIVISTRGDVTLTRDSVGVTGLEVWHVLKEEAFRSMLLELGGQKVTVRARFSGGSGTPAQVLAVYGTPKADLVVRRAPRDNAPELAHQPWIGGVPVTGRTKDGEWLVVDVEGKKGYVRAGQIALSVAPSPRPADPAAVTSYTVVEGDSLASVAARKKVNFAELVAANSQLANPDLVQPGDVLRLPVPGRAVVVAGDTLTALAERHGVSLKDLVGANPDIRNPDLVRPGDIVMLPVKVHTVVEGDSLSRIAARNGVSLAALERANPQIGNPDEIQIGEAVLVPHPSKTPGWVGVLGHD